MEKSFVNPTPHETSPIIIYKKSSAENVIAVSLGTGLIILARNIPDPSLAKFWLTMTAPAVSVFSTWAWKVLTGQYFRVRQWIKKKRLNRKIKAEMETALTDPDIADDEKERLKRERAKMKLEVIDVLTRKLRAIQQEEK